MKVYEITCREEYSGSMLLREIVSGAEIEDALSNVDVGNTVTVKVLEMTEKEYNAL